MKRKLKIGQEVWYEISDKERGVAIIEEINYRHEDKEVESRTPIYIFDESKNRHFETYGSDVYEIDEPLSFENSTLVCWQNDKDWIKWDYIFYCPLSFNKFRHKGALLCD